MFENLKAIHRSHFCFKKPLPFFDNNKNKFAIKGTEADFIGIPNFSNQTKFQQKTYKHIPGFFRKF